MLIKILSMTFDSARGGFNDDELRDFIKDKADRENNTYAAGGPG
jgi:hypothetical protein